MPEYQESGTVAAGPDAVFGYVSNPANLPEYIPHMVTARAHEGGLRVAAEVDGRHEEGDAWLGSDAARRRIEWGGDESSSYRGFLEVAPAGAGSAVSIHLSTDRNDDETEIRRSLQEALRNIARNVAGQQ